MTQERKLTQEERELTQEEQEVIEFLDSLNSKVVDQEDGHKEADEALLRAVHPLIRDAYKRLVERMECFWYS